MNSRSFAAAIISCPSAVSNTSYGAISGKAVPRRPGAIPVATVSASWYGSSASVVSNSETSTSRPAPVEPRSISAARIPSAAHIPVPWSIAETPSRTPGRSGSPVTLMIPPKACISGS